MAGSDIITIRYGSYVHPQGTTAYTLNRQAVLDGRKFPTLEEFVVTLEGSIHGTSPADIETKWQALVVAYQQQGVDFDVLINGVTNTFTIPAATCLGGTIRVTRPPSLPNTRNAAHHTYLPFSIELQATLPIVGSAFALLSFKESLSFSGGGPRTTMIESLYGTPVKQQTRAATIYRCTQSGQAVSLFGNISIPAAIFPADMTGEYTAQRDSPNDHYGLTGTGRAASWSYQFESANPMIGFPNEWGTNL